MFSNKTKGVHPILKHTPFLGSARTKIVHSTENPCSEAFLILVDDRWYIRTIPAGGGYSKCPKCFPSKGEG